MIEAYKIGVVLALQNHMSSGLNLIVRDLAKTDAAAKSLQKTLREIALIGGIGAAVAGVGGVGLHMLHKAYDAAKEYERVFAQFKSLNLGGAINEDANRFARGAHLYGVSATTLMSTLRDMHTTLNDYDKAKAVAPVVAQMIYANKAVFGGHGRQFGKEQAQAALKVIEMRGGWKTTEDLLRQLDMIQHVMTGTGGMVMPSDMLNFLKTGGTAAKNLSDKDFYFGMEPLIQEMGGHRVGTGLMSAYQNLVLGKGTTAAAKELARLHLVDPSKVEYDKIGHVKRIRPGALVGNDLYQSSTQEWVEKILLPTLTKDGAKIDQQVIEKISYLFGQRTGAMLIATMFQQQDKIAKAVAIDVKAMGVSDLIKLARSNPSGAEEALAESWKDLKIAAGESLVPIVIPALNRLSKALRDFGEWTQRHPIRFDWLIKGFAGLSTAMVIGGALGVVVAGFKGLGVVLELTLGPKVAATVASMSKLAVKMGLVFGVVDQILSLLDPKDRMGVWIDKNVPGASWLDNQASKIGLGRSYAQQAEAAALAVGPAPSSKKTVVEVPVYLDKRQIAKSVADVWSDEMNGPLKGASTFDGGFGFVAP